MPVWDDPATWADPEKVRTTKLNREIRDKFREQWIEIFVGTPAANVASGVAYGSVGTSIQNAGSISYRGTPCEFRIWSPRVGGAAFYLGITEGTPGTSALDLMAAGGNEDTGVWRLFYTPTAGAHTFHFAIWNGTIIAPFQCRILEKAYA